jgi:hypothetical protein
MDLAWEAIRYAWETAVWLYSHRERARWWRQAAELCGLTDVRVRKAVGWTWAMEGRSGPLHVRVESVMPRRDPLGATIVIDGLPPTFFGPDTDPERTFGAGDLEADGDVDVPPMIGPPLLLCAVLGPETRRLVRNLFAGRIDVEGQVRTWDGEARLGQGTLRTSFVAGPQSSRFELAEVLGALLDLTRRLLPPGDVERAVAERARTEPQPAARLHHLRTLVAHGTQADVREETLAAALSDPAPELRLEAARESGEAGRPVLQALAVDEDAPDASRSQAVAALGSRLDSDVVRSVLAGALARDRVKTATACIGLLETRGPEQVEPIAASLANERRAIAAAAARALAQIGSAQAEPRLIEALARGGDVSLEAVTALGRVGTVASVLPLRELEQANPRERAFVRACRTAVASIQARLTGAEQGQVGLAEPDDGRLALADDASGRLALEGTGEPSAPLDAAKLLPARRT